MILQGIILIGALCILLPAVVTVVTSIFRGGFDDVDTRSGPRRRFPK